MAGNAAWGSKANGTGRSGNPAGRKHLGETRAELFRVSYARLNAATGKTLLMTTIDKIVDAGALGDFECAKLGLESALGKVMDQIQITDGGAPLDMSKYTEKELLTLMALLKKGEPDDFTPPDAG